MSTQGPTPPAGWYPDVQDAAVQRYWDGSAWTTHTAPGGAPPASAAAASSPGFGGWWNAQANAIKIALIAGAVLVLLLVVGGIGAAARGGQSAALVTQETPVDAPVESSTPTASPTPSETAAPVDEGPDATYFMTEANGNLSDYEKDLGDLIVTLDEDGFWRLISNSVELSFNLGQLQALEAPAVVASEWAAALATLEAQTTAISDDIGNQQYDTLRADIAAAQETCAALHAIADRAVG